LKRTKAEIKDIKNETHDVKTFRLAPEESIDFTPGQYCLVSIAGSSKHEGTEKPFTYASSPTADYVELTVKKIGEFTKALHELEVGDSLILDGPRGKSLNFDETIEEDVVFLAGGSGITPFMSAIRYAIRRNLENKMTLIFSNRTEEDIIYIEELDEVNRREGFRIVNTLTDSWPQDWKGETGYIDRAMLEKYVNEACKKIWYICGPPPMIDSMEKLLAEENVPGEKIRYEKWMIPGKYD